jgi:hypothetical protein
LCQPRVIVKMIVEKQMECRLAGETEVLGENLPQRHFCPSQNPTWPDPGLNPARRGGKPATNRLSYGAAKSTTYQGPHNAIFCSTYIQIPCTVTPSMCFPYCERSSSTPYKNYSKCKLNVKGKNFMDLPTYGWQFVTAPSFARMRNTTNKFSLTPVAEIASVPNQPNN